MMDLFIQWMGFIPSSVTDDVKFAVACIAAFLILKFLLDFFQYLMYICSRR